MYWLFLAIIFSSALLATGLQLAWTPSRKWLAHISPIIAATILTLGIWDLVTTGFHLLPLPYFPGPAAVLQSLISDRQLLLESAGNSLILLLSGYAIGVAIALVTGICIGWFAEARYWGMPLLKVVGPIPATALPSSESTT